MKKNWNKLINNFKTLGQINSNISSDKSLTNEESNESLFLRQILKTLDNDIHRSAFLQFCGQMSVLSFEDVFSKDLYRDLVRFDYGSYAELFSCYDNQSNELVVLKVIRALSSDLRSRIRGVDFESKDGSFEEIHNEFQISEELSRLRELEEYETHCFPRIYGKYLVSGDIPEYLSKDQTSDELPPIKEDIFEDFVSIRREYAVLVMSFGGHPLWKAMREKTISGVQLLSVMRQLTLGLAVAEAAVEFEHRDLHIANILIKNTSKMKIHFIYNFSRYSVDSEGFEATIIDTTFSRIRIGNKIHCKNLTNIMKFDEESTLSTQEKCYKSMLKLTKNDWNKFTPKTNINWLSFICKILMHSQNVKESDDHNIEHNFKELYEMFKQKQSLQELDLTLLCK